MSRTNETELGGGCLPGCFDSADPDVCNRWSLLRLTSGPLSLCLCPGIGGRLWDIEYHGHSLLFQNPDLAGVMPDLQSPHLLPSQSPQFGIPLWGGEKTWVAPDRDWPLWNGQPGPFVALDSGAYQVVSNSCASVTLRSPICPVSHLQIERRISVAGENSWSLSHQLRNRGTERRFCGIWSVMMLNQPCQIGLVTGPERPLLTVFGDAGSMATQLGQNTFFDCHSPREFKLAMDNPTGRVLLHLPQKEGDTWMRCETTPMTPQNNTAHDRAFEVFNSCDYPYAEAEWHSPAVDLLPGAKIELNQTFTLFQNREIACAADTTLQELELFTCMS